MGREKSRSLVSEQGISKSLFIVKEFYLMVATNNFVR